ncbi:hypothetical protein AX16_009625 [Volvariella volvacea WC 439]|nr:hypothetical protein AX16_009625 [Volvariella volvacea WC 439]
MTLPSTSKANPNDPPPPFTDAPAEAGSASYSPPQFDDIVFAPGPEERDPPPEFTPYDAEFFLTGEDDVVSHDPHLNSDGEALYRFLLSQSQNKPSYRLRCRGTHQETRTRWVRHHHDDSRQDESRLETTNETVTDFDFYIDITQFFDERGPVQWTVPDSEPAYRGTMWREVDVEVGPITTISASSDSGEDVAVNPTNGYVTRKRRKVTAAEEKAYKKWVEERTARGLPPWVGGINGWREGMIEDDEVDVLASSKTVRQWADEYCASPKFLKEFVYDKTLYGWNMQQLESAIRSSILHHTMYFGDLTVEFQTRASKVYIRPDNRLSRMLSNKWLKFLSMILLIFPFIWLFKRFHSRGGGKWQVCGGAYALKRWVPLTDEELEELENSPDRLSHKGQTNVTTPSRPTIVHSSRGPSKLVGMREGEWFRKWEMTIVRAVQQRYQSYTPIYAPTVAPPTLLPAHNLDGY